MKDTSSPQMLAILGNIRVDTQERFAHLRASVLSCLDIEAVWHVNARGSLREEVKAFFLATLGARVTLYEFVDESRGWLATAERMLKAVPQPYILVWNEDHMNVAPGNLFGELVKDMVATSADYLPYSWWQAGRLRRLVDLVPSSHIQSGNVSDTIVLDVPTWRSACTKGYPYYIISLTGIFRRELFQSLLVLDQKKWAYSKTEWAYRLMTALNRLGIAFHQRRMFARLNRLLRYRLRRFPAYYPFDLEKGQDREDVLPLRVTMPRQELFACIDDDLDLPGSQLIKRGIYPVLDGPPTGMNIMEMGEVTKLLSAHKDCAVVSHALQTGGELIRVYYEEGIRTIGIKHVGYLVVSGRIRLEGIDQEFRGIYTAGQWLSLPGNIRHKLTAESDSIILEVAPNRLETAK
jgi:hypothetical protein